jgi:tetratricopeptide (TPR) repeat protein
MTTHESDTAYDHLPGPAAALYRQLGASPTQWIDADGLAVLTDLDARAGESLATVLVHAGLLRADDDGFSLSPEGHLHARLKAEEAELDEHELNTAGVDRLFAFLNAAAGAAERLITPSHRPLWDRDLPVEPAEEPPFPLEEVAALNWLERRLPIYMDVIRFAFVDHRYGLACDLAYRLWPLWLRRRHPDQCVEALTLGLAAAYLTRNENAIGLMLTSLAEAFRSNNSVAGYEYNRRAAHHYEQIGDTKGLAQALNGLGKSLLHAGMLEEAEQHFRDAEQLRTGLGYIRGAALSRQGRGRVALARGEANAAADLLLSAHQMLLGVGDSYDAGLTLAHHAEALAKLGDIDGALAELFAVSTTMRQVTSLYGEALVWETRARILAAAGRDEQAQAARAKAVSLFERVDPPSAARVRELAATG